MSYSSDIKCPNCDDSADMELEKNGARTIRCLSCGYHEYPTVRQMDLDELNLWRSDRLDYDSDEYAPLEELAHWGLSYDD